MIKTGTELAGHETDEMTSREIMDRVAQVARRNDELREERKISDPNQLSIKSIIEDMSNSIRDRTGKPRK